MFFNTTLELLETISPYVDNNVIDVDSSDKTYKSDLVIVDKHNNVGFDILENEIIVFYFSEHYHFEDYSININVEDPDYIQRCKEFLLKLFTQNIRCVETLKGKNLLKRYYYFDNEHTKTEEFISAEISGGIWKFINPFTKKTVKTTLWKYNIEQRKFVKASQ